MLFVLSHANWDEKGTPMRTRAYGSLVAALFLPSVSLAAAYVPAAGYSRVPQTFYGDTFAIAPDGKVAIAQTFPSVKIDVYSDTTAAQAATSPIQTFTPAGAVYWGDLTFADNNTLLFSENQGLKTVLSGNVSTGATINLAPNNSIPNAAGIALKGGSIYAVSATNPGTADVYKLNDAVTNPTAVINNTGIGYLGGIAFDAAGNMLLTDTNDPTFAGLSGKLLRYDNAFAPLTPIDLASGNGTHAYDVAIDTEGDIFVTTESTLTTIPFGTTTAQQFGTKFTDAFFNSPFPTTLEYIGTGFERDNGAGQLWVNAGFTDDGSILGIATPEPGAGMLLLLAGATFGAGRKRK